MESQSCTVYGVVWRRYPESAHLSNRSYFKGWPADSKRPVFLHRYVWQQERGEIPRGWHVHHKDGDTGNNEIGNLECISPREHSRRHPKPPGWNAENLRKALPALRRWFKTPEAKVIAKKRSRAMWDNKRARTFQCAICRKAFSSTGQRTKFCGNACRQADFRARHPGYHRRFAKPRAKG